VLVLPARPAPVPPTNWIATRYPVRPSRTSRATSPPA
jgi:hypothetical protein